MRLCFKVNAIALEGARAPCSRSVSRQSANSSAKRSGGTPSSKSRMRLSQEMASTPKSVWQLEREVSCRMRRWNSRNDGAWKKKTDRAQEAASLRA